MGLGSRRIIEEIKIKTMSEEKTEIEKARQLLAKVTQEKHRAFMKEINDVCERHGFQIEAVAQIAVRAR